MNTLALQRAFKAFLDEKIKDWHEGIWLTLTFRKYQSLEGAVKRFKCFFKNLNTTYQSYFDNYIYAFIFYERQNFRRGIHIHAIINRINPNDSLLMNMLERECLMSFGEVMIKPIHENVTKYVSEKYSSEKLEHFDYYKINSKLRKKVE